EEAIAKVRETLKGTGNVEDVKSALAELNEKSQKIGQEIYAQAQAAEQNGGANASGAAGGSGASGSSDDNIVDAEVVDDEENK
ncbi:MAG: molecular chaperone DnaK, partial [Actinotignum schaalii]|nr:molecular chaperone DnaK [Actinotignum schaalii]